MWNRDAARDLLRLFHIIFGDFRLLIWQAMAATVVQALDVRTGDAEEDIADHHIAAVLRTHQRIVHTGLDLFEIDDLAFAYAT